MTVPMNQRLSSLLPFNYLILYGCKFIIIIIIITSTRVPVFQLFLLR